jgi:ribonuclease HI
VAEGNKPKFYVVWEGRRPGIYTAWPDAERQVAGYPKAKFKGFSSRQEAETAFRGRYWDYAGKEPKAAKKPAGDLAASEVLQDSIAVDAACSGVPGPMEYRGVHVGTGEELFHIGPFPDGTNNIGEFLAIAHALALLKEQGKPDMPIYSDSYNARKWIRDKVCRTNVEPTSGNAPIFDLIDEALRWLKINKLTNPILTWETREWGENPADFGRK